MKFLGVCRVCGQSVRNYVGLSQHLRFNQDAAHQQLKKEWYEWRDTYKATLRCRKCGNLWEITDKSLKDSKRCPSCEKLRQSMSKRQYEKLKFDKPEDPRVFRKSLGSKAQWDGLSERFVQWEEGDEIYQAVESCLNTDMKIPQIIKHVGVSYKVFREIAETVLGGDGYSEWATQRIYDRTVAMAEVAHEKYRNMTPEEKAAYFAKFKRGSQLERTLASQLESDGLLDFVMNVWQSVPVNGKMAPREADIKLSVGDGRKIVILCDGIAFHGPKTIYGSAKDRIANDVATADAYFSQGYSVLRVSEDEVHNGNALFFVQEALDILKTKQQYYRTWCPPCEKVA